MPDTQKKTQIGHRARPEFAKKETLRIVPPAVLLLAQSYAA